MEGYCSEIIGGKIKEPNSWRVIKIGGLRLMDRKKLATVKKDVRSYKKRLRKGMKFLREHLFVKVTKPNQKTLLNKIRTAFYKTGYSAYELQKYFGFNRCVFSQYLKEKKISTDINLLLKIWAIFGKNLNLTLPKLLNLAGFDWVRIKEYKEFIGFLKRYFKPISSSLLAWNLYGANFLKKFIKMGDSLKDFIHQAKNRFGHLRSCVKTIITGARKYLLWLLLNEKISPYDKSLTSNKFILWSLRYLKLGTRGLSFRDILKRDKVIAGYKKRMKEGEKFLKNHLFVKSLPQRLNVIIEKVKLFFDEVGYPFRNFCEYLRECLDFDPYTLSQYLKGRYFLLTRENLVKIWAVFFKYLNLSLPNVLKIAGYDVIPISRYKSFIRFLKKHYPSTYPSTISWFVYGAYILERLRNNDRDYFNNFINEVKNRFSYLSKGNQLKIICGGGKYLYWLLLTKKIDFLPSIPNFGEFIRGINPSSKKHEEILTTYIKFLEEKGYDRKHITHKVSLAKRILLIKHLLPKNSSFEDLRRSLSDFFTSRQMYELYPFFEFYYKLPDVKNKMIFEQMFKNLSSKTKRDIRRFLYLFPNHSQRYYISRILRFFFNEINKVDTREIAKEDIEKFEQRMKELNYDEESRKQHLELIQNFIRNSQGHVILKKLPMGGAHTT